MKRIVTLILIVTLFAELLLLYKERTIDAIQEGDDLLYALTSHKGFTRYGDTLVIYKRSVNEKWERIYESDFRALKPWKIELADIDGDIEKEIIIAVRKTTHFDQQERNRIFIFNFDGKKLYKKWTGSQLSGTWNDFYVGNLLSIPGDELITIERIEDNKERVNVCYWFDFGYKVLASSEGYDDISKLTILGENSMQITNFVGNVTEDIRLRVQDMEIIEVNREK